MNTIEKINKFISNEKYNQRKEIVGIIFYGSSKYKTETVFSDIDLLVITTQARNYKGVRVIDNTRIEFFEKSFISLLENIEKLTSTQDASLISIFQNGEVVYGDENTINYLKEQIEIPNRITKRKKTKTKITSYLNTLSATNNPAYQNYFYFNILDQIRKKYHEEKGYNKISGQKAFSLYQNREYAKKYYCLKLPNQEFIDLYSNAVKTGYNKELLEKLLSEINYQDEQNLGRYPIDKSRIRLYSTVVENSYERTITELKKDSDNCQNSYYLTIEKIRILYCLINNLNHNIELFGEEYDLEFMESLDKAIKNISFENITNLFNYVTKDIDIDYKDYKILDLK